jgi:hypothetical protein
VLSKAVPLRFILIGYDQGRMIVHTSVLKHVAIYANQLKTLTKLRLSIAVSDN